MKIEVSTEIMSELLEKHPDLLEKHPDLAMHFNAILESPTAPPSRTNTGIERTAQLTNPSPDTSLIPSTVSSPPMGSLFNPKADLAKLERILMFTDRNPYPNVYRP